MARRARQHEGDEEEVELSAGEEGGEEEEEEDDERMPAEVAVRVSLAGGVSRASKPRVKAAGGHSQEHECAPVHLRDCKLHYAFCY